MDPLGGVIGCHCVMRLTGSRSPVDQYQEMAYLSLLVLSLVQRSFLCQASCVDSYLLTFRPRVDVTCIIRKYVRGYIFKTVTGIGWEGRIIES